MTTPGPDGAHLPANVDRFSGFAELYDEVRPTPPDELVEVLVAYLGRPARDVVDLGSGTGLSTRWAAGWAASVVGVEPNPDMRASAEAATPAGCRWQAGYGHDTGLPDASADVVLAVQALHWMEPTSTLAEVRRLLRPGGVFAAIDCDWPPSVGSAEAERAWADCRRVIGAYEARVAAGLAGEALLAPVGADELAGGGRSNQGPHGTGGGATGGGRVARGWPKEGHLQRMVDSGRFRWCTEVATLQHAVGGAERFVDLLRSQGDYQTMRRAGLDDDRLGVTDLLARCRAALGEGERVWRFTYRARIGVVAA